MPVVSSDPSSYFAAALELSLELMRNAELGTVTQADMAYVATSLQFVLRDVGGWDQIQTIAKLTPFCPVHLQFNHPATGIGYIDVPGKEPRELLVAIMIVIMMRHVNSLDLRVQIRRKGLNDLPLRVFYTDNRMQAKIGFSEA